MSETEGSKKFELHLHGPLVEPTARWVRVKFGGRFIADSRNVLLLRQYGPGKLPEYYFPEADIDLDALSPPDKNAIRDGKIFYAVKVGEKNEKKAAWQYLDPPPELADLKGMYSFRWHKMAAWFEEEEEVFVHARDPYKRVDVMPSSRHIRVEIDGVTVAESRRPHLLFETGLPVRYYLPSADVRMDLFEPAKTKTSCPYKGEASYWSFTTERGYHKDVLWSYPDPIPEAPKIKDLMCFFNEKVDIYEDGGLLERPFSPWS